ncbi:MAG: carotenoid 1,2-hydratase [Burkholderiales bacterium]
MTHFPTNLIPDCTKRLSTKNGGPLFTEKVDRDGYVWWYVDALSDDGRYGLTIIAFIGSVFSPYYAWARQRPGGASPQEHCAINIALYDGLAPHLPSAPSHGHRWAMTERASRHVVVSDAAFQVGPSTMLWDGAKLIIKIDEISLPIPARLRGLVIVEPLAIWHEAYPLDAGAQHHWRPIAPLARVRVEMSEPKLAWQGSAYVDSNHGSAPLESAFVRWDWSRGKQTATPANDAKPDKAPAPTFVVYDVHRTDGTRLTLAKEFSVPAPAQAATSEFTPPPHQALPTTGWRIKRATACDDEARATVVKTVEDTPFYARSVVRSVVNKQPMIAVHESLSLERFSSRWVQCLLPFKMPRRR